MLGDQMNTRGGLFRWDHVSFADTLASVGYVQIGASSITGSQLLGLDNVTLTPCLFSDGFESGDTSAWTATVP